MRYVFSWGALDNKLSHFGIFMKAINIRFWDIDREKQHAFYLF